MNNKSSVKQTNRNKSSNNKRNNNSNSNSINNSKSKGKMVITTTSTVEAATTISNTSNNNNNNKSKADTNSKKSAVRNSVSDNNTRNVLNVETKVNDELNNVGEPNDIRSVDKENDLTNSQPEVSERNIGDNSKWESGTSDKNGRSVSKEMKNVLSVVKQEEQQRPKNTCEVENMKNDCQDASVENEVEIPAITLPANLRTYITEEEGLKLLLGRPRQSHKKAAHGVDKNFTVLNYSNNTEQSENDNNRSRNNNIRANSKTKTNINKNSTSTVGENSNHSAPHLSVDRSLLESLMSSCKYPVEIQHDGDGEVKLTRELLEYLVMAQGVQDGLNDFASTYEEEEYASGNTSKLSCLNDCSSSSNTHEMSCTDEFGQRAQQATEIINIKIDSQSKGEYNSSNNKNIPADAIGNSSSNNTQPHLGCTYFPPLRCVRTFSSVMPIPFSAFNPIRRSQHIVKLTPTQEENVMRSFDKMLKTCHGSALCTITKESSKVSSEILKNTTVHEKGNEGIGDEVGVPEGATTTDLNAKNVGADCGDNNRQCAQVDCYKKLINEINEPLPFVSAFFDQHCPEVRNYLSGTGNEETNTRLVKSLRVNSNKVRQTHHKYENSGATYLMLAVITGHTTLARRCLEEGCANPNNMSFLRQIGELANGYEDNKETLHDEIRKKVSQSDDYNNNTTINTNKSSSICRSADANICTTFAENMYTHCDSSSDYNYMKRQMQFNDMLMEMKHGYSPLFMAIIAEQLEIAEMLYSFGGSVHIYDRWGRTPLQAALTLQSSEVVQWLLSKGAPRYVPDCFSSAMPAALHDCAKQQQQHHHKVCDDISSSSLSSIPPLALCGFPLNKNTNIYSGIHHTVHDKRTSHCNSASSLSECAHVMSFPVIPTELSSIAPIGDASAQSNVNTTQNVKPTKNANFSSMSATKTEIPSSNDNELVDDTNHHLEAISAKAQKIEKTCTELIHGERDASTIQSNITTSSNNTVNVSIHESTGTHKFANDDDKAKNEKLKNYKEVTHTSLCDCHSGRASGYCGCIDDMFIRWRADRLRVRWSLNMNLYKLATDVSGQKEVCSNLMTL